MQRDGRWKLAVQLVPGWPRHRQVGCFDQIGELAVDLVVDLPHLRHRHESIGAIGAELPAIQVSRMPRNDVGQLRLPELFVGLEQLEPRKVV